MTTAEQLFAAHQTLALDVARIMHARLHASLQRDELENAALCGLWDAAQRYDPARGAKFATFAAPRMRGAVLDWVRTQDPVPRGIRHSKRRVPAPAPRRVPLRAYRLADPGDPFADVELADLVASFLPLLGERPWLAFRLHYVEGQTQKAIAVRLGVVSSAVSHALRLARQTVRATLEVREALAR